MDVIRDYLFNSDKIKYVKNKKPLNECILCAIRDSSPDLDLLEVQRTDKFIISVNLYPFNPGHLMIFPMRHIEDIIELSDTEASEMHSLTAKAVSVLRD